MQIVHYECKFNFHSCVLLENIDAPIKLTTDLNKPMHMYVCMRVRLNLSTKTSHRYICFAYIYHTGTTVSAREERPYKLSKSKTSRVWCESRQSETFNVCRTTSSSHLVRNRHTKFSHVYSNRTSSYFSNRIGEKVVLVNGNEIDLKTEPRLMRRIFENDPIFAPTNDTHAHLRKRTINACDNFYLHVNRIYCKYTFFLVGRDLYRLCVAIHSGRVIYCGFIWRMRFSISECAIRYKKYVIRPCENMTCV